MPNCNIQSVSGANPNINVINTGALQVITGNNSNIFDPNKMLSGIQTFTSLNYTVNKMLGLDTKWFRAVPEQTAKDVILQEYTLYNVVELPECVKVMLPNGNVPDSKYNYDLMGLEYEIPLEIQIDKRYWEELVGGYTAPQKKDIVYIPMFNKLYQVESSFLKRGFMEQETTWVANLKKYSPESSRKEGDALKETLLKYTVSEESLFGEAIDNEFKQITNDKQFSPFNSTSQDKYKILNTNLKVIQSQLNIFGVVAAETYYDLNTSELYDAITYKDINDAISTDQDRSYLAWFNSNLTSAVYDIVSITKDDLLTPPSNYKIKVKTTKAFQIGDVFNIYRPGSLNFYATVMDDSDSANSTYYCQIDFKVEQHLTSIKSNWSNIVGYKMMNCQPINLLTGRNGEDTKLKLNIYANQYIKVQYGSQEYIAILNEKIINNNWYAIVVNIGNTWNQYNVQLWSYGNDVNNKIKTIFYETMDLVPEAIDVNSYVINKSNSYLTNIRLFNKTIEEEKQYNELLSYFTKNADLAIILDNCDLIAKMPYTGKAR